MHSGRAVCRRYIYLLSVGITAVTSRSFTSNQLPCRCAYYLSLMLTAPKQKKQAILKVLCRSRSLTGMYLSVADLRLCNPHRGRR